MVRRLGVIYCILNHRISDICLNEITEFRSYRFSLIIDSSQASIGEVPSETTYGAFASVVRRHGVGGLLHGLPTRSVLHAVVWCVVGAGREACERFGLRDTWSEKNGTYFS